ncbi:MAG: AraC family transcriptional regulator [Rhodopseudomonas sp.]|uniref:AraC family transcriptional regulator n=1 Tax=Rhodopseudomonas sp. TaxID=1078 RepID=UPI00179339EC|nr:AraC family transcriptional regulator [Rhodopseudomonas sp.]NVN85600.1 AraC family transcriptional regulator [Rhodopseudomonas sp.]
MTPELLGEPLKRFPIFRTSNRDEFGNAATSVYGAKRFDIPEPENFFAFGNFVQLREIAIGFSSLGGRVTIDFPEADFARLQMSLSGAGTTTINGITTEINAEQSCVTSPGRAALLSYAQGYQQLHLRVGLSAMERTLTALLGLRPKGLLEFDAAAPASKPYAQNVKGLVLFVSTQLDSSPPQLPPLVLVELEHAITLSFLYAYRHSFSRLLEGETPGAAPRNVRQVEEYIEANWDRPITIEQLMAVTDISARGIFKAFQRSRGYSPMAFAKRVRLQHARKMLTESRIDTTVTAVALACGFANLGHFAKDYREMFGEKPSDTLDRSRRSRKA